MKKILIICVLLLSGCDLIQHDKMSQHAIIEWVDFIHTNGEMYQRAYQLEIADQSLVGDIMGEITFKIADHVHDPEYQSKNGDAAYLEPGTEFYSIEGGSDLIAIKDKEAINGYGIYSKENPKGFSDSTTFEKDDLKEVEVFHENSYNQFEFVKMITDHDEIDEFISILQSGQPGNSNGYDDTNPHFQSYAFILYTSAPFARKHSIFFDGESYSWSPWDNEILSSEIERFLK